MSRIHQSARQQHLDEQPELTMEPLGTDVGCLLEERIAAQTKGI
jgi:hypothetical protein